MNKDDFKSFSNMIDCYFNQDFNELHGNIENAIKDIILEFSKKNIISLYHQINEILILTKDEKNLEEFLDKTFHIEVTPKVGGDDMNTYTELLEYIRDKIKAHLESKGVKINEEENN
jgi:CdiI immunity protein